MSPKRLGSVNGALAVPLWIALAVLVVWCLAGCAVSFHVQRELPADSTLEKPADKKDRRD